MKKLLLIALLLPAVCFGQNNVQKFVDTRLKCNEDICNSVMALLAVGPDGKVIAQWNADLPLMPASNTKTISTGLALMTLGPEYRFETSLAYSGVVSEDGTLWGDLYICGGGDPTLASSLEMAAPADSVFAQWADALRKAGISRIRGQIIGDNRFFSDDVTPLGWEWDDLGWYYGSGSYGLNFAENLSYFETCPGKTVGSPASIRPLAPYSPEMTYLNEVVTADGRRDGIDYVVSDLYPVGKFSGTLGIQRPVDTIYLANKFSAVTCASAFADFLAAEGISCRGFSDDAQDARDSLTYIGSTFSPMLGEIVYETNRSSNNLFAETLFKTMGRCFAGEGSYDASKEYVKYLLDSLGVPLKGYKQVDGSGLSRHNYISPRFFCNYLSMIEKSDVFPVFFESLPVPGQYGTLENFLRGKESSVRNRIHAKSGSFEGTRCYCGYVRTKGGYIKFSIMLNNYTCPSSRIVPLLEAFAEQLARM